MSKCGAVSRRHCEAGKPVTGFNQNPKLIITYLSTMTYMLLFNESQADFDLRNDPANGQAYWSAWQAYSQALRESAVVIQSAGLQPPETGTTVKVRDGKRHVHDGPYAETKEFLGGFFLIEAPDLDSALEWAARSPAASSASVEVRPVLPSCGG